MYLYIYVYIYIESTYFLGHVWYVYLHVLKASMHNSHVQE